MSVVRQGVWTAPQWGRYRTSKVTGGELVASDGTFRFEKIIPGSYRLLIEQGGFVGEAIAEVQSGRETNVVVPLVRTSVLSFRLAAPAPSAFVEYGVSEIAGSWHVAMSERDPEGDHHERTLRPGRYRWRVKFRETPSLDSRVVGEPVEGEVTVVAGETVVVDVPVRTR